VYNLQPDRVIPVRTGAGGRAGCKLQIANWLRHFLQPLIFLFLFLSRKKEKTLIGLGRLFANAYSGLREWWC
jgi:hypothetical protein